MVICVGGCDAVAQPERDWSTASRIIVRAVTAEPTTQVEEIAVLDGESPPRAGRDVVVAAERLSEPLDVVVDDEEPRVGVRQQAEPQVRRPEVGPVVVLNEGLEEHPRGERVRQAQAGEVGGEVAAGQLQVVVAPLQHRVEGLARAGRDRRGDRHPVAAEQPADDGVEVEADRRAEVRVAGDLRFLVVVGPRRDDDAREDLERCEHAFAADVHAGVDLVAVAPLGVVVDVRELRLMGAGGEVEHGVVRDVGPQLVDSQEVLGAERREHAAVHPPVALPGEEADLRVEVGGHLVEAEAEPEAFRLVPGAEPVRVGASRPRRQVVDGAAVRHEAAHRAALSDSPAPVEGHGGVGAAVGGEVAGRIPVDDHGADVRPVGQVLPHPGHREVLARDRVLVAQLADRRGLHVEEPDVRVVADPARQPPPAADRNLLAVLAEPDAAAEEHVDRTRLSDREQPRVLEEERPLLGKEQREAVQVDLLVVDLDLGEVGVCGQVEGHAGGDAVLQVRPQIAVVEVAPGLGAVQALAEKVGRELEVALGRHRDALHLAGQRDAVEVVLAGEGRPVGLFVADPDVPLEVHAPGLHLGARIAEGPERNGDLGRPPDVGHVGDHLPGAVPVEVEAPAGAALLPAVAGAPAAAAAEPAAALPLVGELPVVLDAGRVGAEDEPVLPVQVGVENDLEAVGLVQRRVAPAVRHDDRAGVRGVADNPEVDGVGVVHDADLGAFRGRLALEGTALHEAGGRHRAGVGGGRSARRRPPPAGSRR